MINILNVFSANFNLIKNSNLKTMMYVRNNNCIFINLLDSAADVMYSICIIWSDLLFYTRIIWNNFRVSKVISYNCRGNLIAFNCIYLFYPNNIEYFSLVTTESQKSCHLILMILSSEVFFFFYNLIAQNQTFNTKEYKTKAKLHLLPVQTLLIPLLDGSKKIKWYRLLFYFHSYEITYEY